MLTHRFYWEEWEDVGSWGFRAVERPDFDPITGMGIAHDILEHLPADPMHVGGEFMAMGAVMLIRCDTGWFARNNPYNPDGLHHLASEFIQMWHQYEGASHFMPAPVDHSAAPFRDADIEERFQIACQKGRKLILSEFSYDGICPKEVREFCDIGLLWMRIGYREAKRRYRDHDPFTLSYFFDDLTEIAKIAEKHCEEGIPGPELHIKTDFRNLTCSADLYEYRLTDLSMEGLNPEHYKCRIANPRHALNSQSSLIERRG